MSRHLPLGSILGPPGLRMLRGEAQRPFPDSGRRQDKL